MQLVQSTQQAPALPVPEVIEHFGDARRIIAKLRREDACLFLARKNSPARVRAAAGSWHESKPVAKAYKEALFHFEHAEHLARYSDGRLSATQIQYERANRLLAVADRLAGVTL